MYKFYRKLNGVEFYAPGSGNKKYDAYVNNKKFSFGDRNYAHYHDRIGYYKDLNHYNTTRRDNYINRHSKDNITDFSPGYFSMYYLWR
jgi:hypothetical protein